MVRLALPGLVLGSVLACTPPLRRVQKLGTWGCEGTFENVAKASLYGNVSKQESCFVYRSLGWSAIQSMEACREVGDVFFNGTDLQIKNPFGEGCTLDNDNALVFGETDSDKINTIYCIRK